MLSQTLPWFTLTHALQGIFTNGPMCFWWMSINCFYDNFFQFSHADWLLLIVTCNAILSGAVDKLILRICCVLQFLNFLWQNQGSTSPLAWWPETSKNQAGLVNTLEPHYEVVITLAGDCSKTKQPQNHGVFQSVARTSIASVSLHVLEMVTTQPPAFIIRLLS